MSTNALEQNKKVLPQQRFHLKYTPLGLLVIDFEYRSDTLYNVILSKE